MNTFIVVMSVLAIVLALTVGIVLVIENGNYILYSLLITPIITGLLILVRVYYVINKHKIILQNNEN